MYRECKVSGRYAGLSDFVQHGFEDTWRTQTSANLGTTNIQMAGMY
jgi:hypothetical protein